MEKGSPRSREKAWPTTTAEQAIVEFLRGHGPVKRDPALRSRGTSDILTMVGCGYVGGLSDFRRHLRRAQQKGLIHGDLFNYLAAGAEDSVPNPQPEAAPSKAQVIDLTEPTMVKTTNPEPNRGVVASTAAGPVVEAIANFDRSDEALRLLAARALSYGALLDFSIEIDRERPAPSADPRPGPRTRRATEALWIRGFEPTEISEVLNFSETLATALCEPLTQSENLREVVSLHLAGMPAGDIGRAVGVGLDVVKRTLRRVGFVPRPAQRREGATVARQAKGPPDHQVHMPHLPSSGA